MTRRAANPGRMRALDWELLKRRLDDAGRALSGAAEVPPERTRQLLEDRARILGQARATPSVGETIDAVSFSLAGETFAIALTYVVGISRVTPLACTPASAAPMVALTEWRGDLLPVLDLRPALALPAGPIHALDRLLVLGERRAVFGVLVDSVLERLTILRAELGVPQTTPSGRRRPLLGVTRSAIQLLDGADLLRLHPHPTADRIRT